ncbi:MAG: FtsW/RodA/SpoVE family cell cycle protein [Candidatus Dependentiae bacterium]
MYENNRLQQDFHMFIGLSALLAVLGAVFVYSASSLYALERLGSSAHFFYRHLGGMVVALIGFAVCALVPFSLWQKHASLVFGTTLGVTALTLVPRFGFAMHGMQRWLLWGQYAIQPSELLKFSLCLYVGYFLAKKQRQRLSLSHGYLPLLVVIGVACMVLFNQGDWGTATLCIATFLIVAFIADCKGMYLWWTTVGLLPFAGLLAWRYPQSLQRALHFFNPWHDPQGAGHELVQSLIAIGSGSWWGAGVAYSKQKFFQLPLQHTEGIFAIIAEEVGFLGCLIMLTGYVLFALLGIRLARQMSDPFAAYTVLGCVVLISLQSMLNILMAVGMLPLTGLGLPFMSYSGSGLLGLGCMLGLITNAYHREQVQRIPAQTSW